MNQITDVHNEPEATPMRPVSIAEKFISAFFHESNIKWMLFIGAAIVAVSSLKLVAQQWDQWSTVLKFLAILAYVGVVYGFSEASEKLLGLRSTSTVLKLLTLILLPISFFSLPWLSSNAANNMSSLVPLLVGGGLFAAVVSDRILSRFLLGRQLVFQFAYVGLSIAGALPVMVDGSLAVGAAIWAVGTIGIVKVNRHVFWLAEQYRKPMVFGFFPVLLLGTQMFVLFATKLDWMQHVEWLGFGLVLCAVPIMFTARTVASVFRARTGGLITTIPIAIVIPTFVALVLGLAGVGLSFHGVHWVGETTKAVVPTAMMASALALIAARDSRNAGFTWLAIVLMGISYQMAPTLVSSLAKQLISAAAESLSEERLPYAFYGLTYLPLLLGWAVASRTLAKAPHFAKPFQIAATCLTLVLMPLSLTHFKAAFLIPILHSVLFLFYAINWKDRRYTVLSLLSGTIATAFFVPYANAMLGMSINILHIGTCLGVVGCGLLIVPVDRWLERIPLPASEWFPWPTWNDGTSISVARVWGGLIMLALGSVWFGLSINNLGNDLTNPQCAVGLLCATGTLIAVRNTRNYQAGLGFSLVMLILVASASSAMHWSASELLDAITYASVSVSILGCLAVIGLRRTLAVDWKNERRILGFVFSNPEQTEAVSVKANASPWMALILPLADLSTLFVAGMLSLHGGLLLYASFAMDQSTLLTSGIIAFTWMLFAILVLRSRTITALFAVVLPLLVSSFLQSNGYVVPDLRYSAPIWAITLLATGVITRRFEQAVRAGSHTHNGNEWGSLTSYVPYVLTPLLLILAASGVCMFSIPLQISALISLVALYLLHQPPVEGTEFAVGCIWANAVVLMLVLPIIGIDADALISQFLWGRSSITNNLPSLLVVMVVNTAFVRSFGLRFQPLCQAAWVGVLRLASFALLLSCFAVPELSATSVVLLIVASLGMTVQELVVASREKREASVWLAMGIVGVCALILLFHGWLFVSNGYGSLAAVLVGLLMQWLSTLCMKHESSEIASRPLRIVGLTLPLLVTSFGVASLFVVPQSMPWIALAIFTAAFSHAYQGWTTGQRWHVWLSVAMVNIGIANLNRMWGFEDLQLYLAPIGISILGLVELMKQEVPQSAHKPIRIVGSLFILVSPVFEILGGSWWHMFSLMLLSVLVVLISIGLRVRVLMFTGVAFLFADLLAMLVRSAIDHPQMLWASGLALGLLVMAMAAVCEIYRERLLSRMRFLSSELATWN